jgi:hypothetical protein
VAGANLDVCLPDRAARFGAALLLITLTIHSLEQSLPHGFILET